MIMLIAQVVLSALVATAVLSLVRPRRWSAIVLALLSAAWLPANNTHLEGAVLIVIDQQHGLTTADLISYTGFLLAGVTMVRWSRVSRRGLVAGGSIVGMAALAGAAMTATWILQPY